VGGAQTGGTPGTGGAQTGGAAGSGGSTSILFSDDFNRPDSTRVGNGWVEIETSGTVDVAGNTLLMNPGDSDRTPGVTHSFTQVSSGTLTFEFDMDWTQTTVEGVYDVVMQLGQGMVTKDLTTGVGVYLGWGKHDTEAEFYVNDGNYVNVGTGSLNGAHSIEVSVDMTTHTYSVKVDGETKRTDVAFRNSVSLDTVRFLTSSMALAYYTGRTFDNVSITVP